ncbi:hypothetical protein [Clostridium tagluense]|uniref:hypothetical protein n=1 Tax=Clostridium tagluense TaxID=360422 RepID=UPI001C6DF403|nr:hypothetical protein [Clostridium tagluense]MBW9154882.1 hypothetical protein [Clostridium tagluense]WLC64337.1 hypothetical protein KTC93_15865 [Clostridium tagluense]
MVCNLTDENIIKIGTYNFFTKALETYNKNQFVDEEEITDFIKVMLPNTEDKAKKQWDNGIVWDGRLYKAWFSTVGGMKQEDIMNNSKCEVIFLNTEKQGFNTFFEDLISLGKFAKVNKTIDMFVNKEILSRLSLATSELIAEIEMPNIIILPQAKLPWKRTYKTVKPKESVYKDKDSNEIKGIDYDLVDHDFDGELDIFDGGGIGTNKVFDTIGKALGRNDIDFAICRGFGISIKGMITRFNIIAYLDVMYSKIGDTDYCKKVNGHYELLDMYDQWKVVTDNTILLNKSMVKLAGMFENMEEYNTLIENCNCEKHMNSYNLLNKLYITKVNKKDIDVKKYRRMNYQLMNGLTLTSQEYNTLAEQDFKMFKKILKPYVKGTAENEFLINVDYINLFYNQCSENSEIEIDDFKEITNVVDKSNTLINIKQENVKLSYVKQNLAKLVEKKIRDMAQGRITLKATYNYIAVDPINYMNHAMTRMLGTNGLAEGEFYCSSIPDGETRTIFRNPCMAYSEIHNVNFVRNVFLDNWLCKSEEIVYFNDKSDILNLMGSADKDGDSCTMVDNEIVRNAVVIPEDGKYFISLADGKKVPCKFDAEGRFLATYTPSGNLIGQVAIMGASVNNNSQQLKTYYSKESCKFYSFEDLKQIFIDNKMAEEDTDYEVVKNIIKTRLVDKGLLFYTNSIESEIIREQMRQQFYKNEKDIYSLLYVSSLVIDSPKTMNCIDVVEHTRVIKDNYKRKANFLKYAERLENIVLQNYEYPLNSTLDNFGERVQEELLDTIARRKKSFADKENKLQEQLINNLSTEEYTIKVLEQINGMYLAYKVEKDEIEKAKDDEATNIKICSKMEWELEGKELTDLKQRYSTNNKNYKKSLDKMEAKFLLKANTIIEENNIYSVASALSKMKKVNERFIITFFISALIAVDKINPSIKSKYYKCDPGESDAIEYMYQTYKKEDKPVNFSDAVIQKLTTNDLVRFKLAAEVRFKNEDPNLIENIKTGLSENKYFDLDITNLEVLKSTNKVLEGKEIVRIIGFMLKGNGDESIANKSFGVCIEL